MALSNQSLATASLTNQASTSAASLTNQSLGRRLGSYVFDDDGDSTVETGETGSLTLTQVGDETFDTIYTPLTNQAVNNA